MKFTKEQTLDFSTNWKLYFQAGKHKKKPVVHAPPSMFKPGDRYWFEPQTHMQSDLTITYHLMYNYLRGLPLDRGLDKSKKGFEKHITEAIYRNWTLRRLEYIFNAVDSKQSYANEAIKELPKTVEYIRGIFGDGITTEVLRGFLKELKDYKYESS